MKILLVLLLPLSAFAEDFQSRTIFRETVGLSEHVFVDIWQITNLRAKIPNNANLFAGLGYRGKAWWVEGMVQKQWRRVGGDYALDFRFQKQFAGKSSLYVETTKFLTRPAFYEFVIVERPIWQKLRLRMEMENVHHPGRDSLAFGGGPSYPILARDKFSLSLAAVYRVQRPEPSAFRVYLVLQHLSGVLPRK